MAYVCSGSIYCSVWSLVKYPGCEDFLFIELSETFYQEEQEQPASQNTMSASIFRQPLLNLDA